MTNLFTEKALLELMKPQNLLSDYRIDNGYWSLGVDASFSANTLVINDPTATNGAAANIVAPILPGSKWRITTSSTFTTGSATIAFAGKVITLVGGADEVWTVTANKAPSGTIDSRFVVNQVVATGVIDVVFTKIELQLMDNFLKEQDIVGYFGRNDIVDDGINN